MLSPVRAERTDIAVPRSRALRIPSSAESIVAAVPASLRQSMFFNNGQSYGMYLDDFKGVNFDFVITVCDHAHEHCPIFPGKTRVVHFSFDDPPRLAKQAATEQKALGIYRRVRDEIKVFVGKLPDNLAV